MTFVIGRFQRLRKGQRCAICGHEGWCMGEFDGAGEPLRVLCKRVPSRTQWVQAGSLHVLRDDVRPAEWSREIVLRTAVPSIAMHERMRRAHERLITGSYAVRAARELGVSADALVALGAGIEWRTLLFPMKDELGRLIGIRTRWADGKKRAVTGSRNGLFLPRNLDREGEVYVCEGPTDAAALLGLGLQAFGRASAGTCTRMTTRLVAGLAARCAMVVADNDDVGCSSAREVAHALRVVVRDVRVIAPPPEFKDAREWVRTGVTQESIRAVVNASEPLGLVLIGGRS